MRATTTLAWSLGVQTAMLLAWMLAFDRKALGGSFQVWRSSLGAGFLGALASQFWFIGFALTTAANVRTLALVEVLMAQAVSHKLFSQATSRRGDPRHEPHRGRGGAAAGGAGVTAACRSGAPNGTL